jgi:hypothetical protein
LKRWDNLGKSGDDGMTFTDDGLNGIDNAGHCSRSEIDFTHEACADVLDPVGVV